MCDSVLDLDMPSVASHRLYLSSGTQKRSCFCKCGKVATKNTKSAFDVGGAWRFLHILNSGLVEPCVSRISEPTTFAR